MATSSSNSLKVCHYSKSRRLHCPLSHLNSHWRRRHRLTSVVVEAFIRLQVATIPLAQQLQPPQSQDDNNANVDGGDQETSSQLIAANIKKEAKDDDAID